MNRTTGSTCWKRSRTLRAPKSGAQEVQTRADGGGGEEGDDGLRDVREVAADAVSGADAEGAQLGGQGADLAAQLGPGDRARLMGLVDVQEGGFVGAGGSSAARRACSA